ncbi:MAG: hypothetical protein PVJ05_03150 [Candidatus Thorarchaeota archaeon]
MKNNEDTNRALLILSSILAIFTGCIGIEHGFFEFLQGDVATEGFLIDAIGPNQEFWPGAMEPAFSIVPNYMITGILAMIAGMLVIIWGVRYIESSHGATILWIFEMFQLLVGGGSAPLVVGTIGCVAASRINKPLSWWRSHLSPRSVEILKKGWPIMFVAYLALALFGTFVAIFGYPLAGWLDFETMFNILMAIGNLTIVIFVIAVISAIANDIHRMSTA